MTDSETQQAVDAALRADQRLSSQLIDVHVEQGRVTLKGRVQSFRSKLVAHDVTAAAADSVLIDNQLEVFRPGNPSDQDIAEDVRALIEHHEQLVKQAVVVEVRAGRVTLSGSVAGESERTLAGDVALEAPGARQVVNQLVIKPAARSEAVVVGHELDHSLAGAPELQGCELRVAISGNVAVLSGTATTRAQVRRAVDLVREGWAGELRQEVKLPD